MFVVSAVALILLSTTMISLVIAPFVLFLMNKFEIRKPKGDRIQKTMYGAEPEVFKKLHPEDVSEKPHALRMGGLLIFIPALVVFIPFLEINAINLLLLFVIVSALLFGIYDDYSVCRSIKSITTKQKLFFFFILGLIVGSVLHFNFGFESISFVLFQVNLGFLYILFSAIWFAMWGSSVVIDGIDRLSGTLFSYVFIFCGILFAVEGTVILSILSFIIVGGLQGFLWHNISPARVHMGETGMVALLLLLSFMSLVSGSIGGDGLLLITLLSIPIHLSIISNVLQLFWRKYKDKKLFPIAPIHHTFETMMPGHAVVSRYSLLTFLLFVLCIVILFR